MKLDPKDFKRLQWAIAFLVLMALVGGGSLWIAQRADKDAERAAKQATAARLDIQGKLARASQEEQELRDKIGRFQALKARGYIGAERRLDWIETIARIKDARRIFRLDYEFSPQRPVDAGLLPEGPSAGGFEFMSSQMHIQLQLLHENELLAFLGDLRAAVQALVRVRSCTLERLGADNAERGNRAQLGAECTLEWVTLKEGK